MAPSPPRLRLRDRIERALEALWEGKAPVLALLCFVPLWIASLFTRVASRRRPARRSVPGCRVVSVGNLRVGGTGKTPVALELCRRAEALGLSPAVVLRGYGGREAGPVFVPADGDAARFGDEAVLHARRRPGTRVVVARDRAAGVALARRAGCRFVALDDGLQQRDVAPDRSVVVIPAEAPYGNGRLLPLGPLRAPPSSLRPTDLRWLHGDASREAEGVEWAIRSRLRALGVVPAARLDATPVPLPAGPLAAFCAIARPGRFFRTLQSLGADVAVRWALADHRRLDAAELQGAAAHAARLGAVALVCTEKDAVRLPPSSDLPDALALPLLALRVEIQIDAGEAHVRELIEAPPAAASGAV